MKFEKEIGSWRFPKKSSCLGEPNPLAFESALHFSAWVTFWDVNEHISCFVENSFFIFTRLAYPQLKFDSNKF